MSQVKEDIIKLINILSDNTGLIVYTILLDDIIFNGVELSTDSDGFRLVKWNDDETEDQLDSEHINTYQLIKIRNQLEKLF